MPRDTRNQGEPMEQCGCHTITLITSRGSAISDKNTMVNFCPLHAAAGAMRDALKPIEAEIQEEAGNLSDPSWNEDFTFEIMLTVRECRAIRAALALVPDKGATPCSPCE